MKPMRSQPQRKMTLQHFARLIVAACAAFTAKACTLRIPPDEDTRIAAMWTPAERGLLWVK